MPPNVLTILTPLLLAVALALALSTEALVGYTVLGLGVGTGALAVEGHVKSWLDRRSRARR